MTAQQQSLYRAARRIGRAFGTGGRTWTLITATGDGVTSAASLAVSGLVSLYVVENNLVRRADTLPAAPIYSAPFWGIGDTEFAAGAILVSGALAFLVQGPPDTSQGFVLTPLEQTPAPDLATASIGAGFRAGLRIGLQAGL